MTRENFKRKLAAILSADVKSYSRLIGEDEDRTIKIIDFILQRQDPLN